MTLHFTQIFFTDARTFIAAALLRKQFQFSVVSPLRQPTPPSPRRAC